MKACGIKLILTLVPKAFSLGKFYPFVIHIRYYALVKEKVEIHIERTYSRLQYAKALSTFSYVRRTRLIAFRLNSVIYRSRFDKLSLIFGATRRARRKRYVLNWIHKLLKRISFAFPFLFAYKVNVRIKAMWHSDCEFSHFAGNRRCGTRGNALFGVFLAGVVIL